MGAVHFFGQLPFLYNAGGVTGVLGGSLTRMRFVRQSAYLAKMVSPEIHGNDTGMCMVGWQKTGKMDG